MTCGAESATVMPFLLQGILRSRKEMVRGQRIISLLFVFLVLFYVDMRGLDLLDIVHVAESTRGSFFSAR